jgi:DNA (cytosine-5)-methyltransferase 1
MIPHFIRAVREIRPRFFIMENVRGLSGPRHRGYLDARKQELTDLGYSVDSRVVDAAEFGVPQVRRRTIVMGVRWTLDEKAPRWPHPVKRQVTMAKALDWTVDDAWSAASLAPVPDHDKAMWVFDRPSTTVVGSFRPDVQAAPGYRAAGDGPRQNAPGSVVTTLEERLVLQGFPRDWKVSGSRTKQDLQVGNSCPPALIAALLRVNGF